MPSRCYSQFPECEKFGYVIVSEKAIKHAKSILYRGTKIARPRKINYNNFGSRKDLDLKGCSFELQIATHPHIEEKGWSIKTNTDEAKKLDKLEEFLELNEYLKEGK